MKNRFGKRFAFYGGVIALLFGILLFQLYQLQIRSGEVYGAQAEAKKTKTIVSRGDRGMILDSQSRPLAYDKMVYNVTFYRDPTWNPGKDGDGNAISAYGRYTSALITVSDIVKQYGGQMISAFSLVRDAETGEWAFDWGDVAEDVKAKRETRWRDNFGVQKTPLQEIFDFLCNKYKLPETLSEADKLGILAIWQEMQMNAFLSKSIVVAQDVNWETVIEIEARLMQLHGIEIGISTKRVYPNGLLASHVIGYIGKIQNRDTFNETLKPKGYQMSDFIGIDGVEKTMEDWLTASSSQRQGLRVVEVDRYGKVNRERSNKEPQNGNNVKLTLNSALQSVAEAALAKNILEIHEAQVKSRNSPLWNERNKKYLQGGDRDFEKQPIKLAEKGALVVIDMEGRVLAMASFPPYDPNAFIVGGDAAANIVLDDRRPLLNYAIGSIDTPGSIFKMVTASAGFASGKLSPYDRISDLGYFTAYDTSSPPRCWIEKGKEWEHANQDIVLGLAHSCNYYFYTVAERIGSVEPIYKYAALYGLTSKTNVELPGELQSIVGSQAMLYDPDRPIKFPNQGTWVPYLVSESIKGQIIKVGRGSGIVFDPDKLDRAVTSCMKMAVKTRQDDWVRNIQRIMMEELDMPQQMAERTEIGGELYRRLNDIVWGGSQTIMTAIGQSITQVSPAAVARYVAAVANGGKVYDLMLVDSIISPEGEVLSKREPTLVSEMPELALYLPFIQQGMRSVVDDGTARKKFENFKYIDQIAAKTGSAEKTDIDLENNAWFVAYAPFDKPEIAVVCYIPNGYGGGYASTAVRDVLEYYLSSRQVAGEDLMGPANALSY